MDLSEEIIWKKIQQKDIAALEGYYKLHYKSFLLLAFNYMKDKPLAQEIVDDVFMKIWEDGSKIEISYSLKSYIYKSIIHRCINAIQKKKREKTEWLEVAEMPDEGYEMRQMEENELKVKLYAAIEELPNQCRRVFEMSRFEELKQQEIADKLGISIKTVKNHITIALKHLSKVLSSLILFSKILFHFS